MSEESATPRKNELTRVKDNFLKVVSKAPKNTAFFVCKALELIWCLAAVSLCEYAFDKDSRIQRSYERFEVTNTEQHLVFATLYGFILVNTVLVLSHILGEQLPKKMQMIFSGVAAVLCCVVGVILIIEPNNRDLNYVLSMDDYVASQLVNGGVLTIMASITFAIETLLTYKYSL